MSIWGSYDNTYGYADEKVGRIKNLPNEGGNLMYMVSMFDNENQKRLSSMLSEESKEEIRKRLLDGGMPPMFINF
jgi:hypothetical protein